MIWEYMNADHTHKIYVAKRRRLINLYLKTYWVYCSICKDFSKGPFYSEEAANRELAFGIELMRNLDDDDPVRLHLTRTTFFDRLHSLFEKYKEHDESRYLWFKKLGRRRAY